MIPSFIWLTFWLREDSIHPEPRWLIAAAFFGGILSVIAAVFAEKYIADIFSDQAPRFVSWLSNGNLRYAIWADVEEIVKIAAVAIIALNSRYNDEPIDAMVYCITVALGFAALENAFFILSPLSQGHIIVGVTTGGLRFIGATLVHTVSAAMIGFSLGYAFYRGAISRIAIFICGITGAIALHAFFNLSLVNSGGSTVDNLRTFAWIWAAVVIMIVLFEEIKAVKPKLN
ncbi:MAG: PrsW family intramembrane metalloprotease [Candidatus Taylorbacteria bacterium]|nr:PrsW family intramembrane metalloprotease [Candidatus Taylorbacteria bacterium]